MLKTRITAVAVIAAAAALVASAGAASAHTRPHPVPTVTSPPTTPPTTAPAPLVTAHALTHLADRPDGGNGTPSTWADDTFSRVLTITQTGGTAGAYTFTAKLADEGTFTTIKGAPTPNQGPGYAGDVIKSKVTGPMEGYADFTFTASKLPSTSPNAGVPVSEDDHGVAPAGAHSTSSWYELAFPAGTTFPSGGIGDWSWTYNATVETVTYKVVYIEVRAHRHYFLVRELLPVVHVTHQKWIDALSNGYGDLAGDGNITG